MKKIIFVCISFLFLNIHGYSQGCVAIKNITGFGQFAELGYGSENQKWSMDINNRIFTAYKFLEGKTNITPADLITGVTIHEYTMNLELNRLLEKGWAIGLDMPICANSTVGELEHASGQNHTTSDFGIGDTRLTVYKWLLNTAVDHKGNIQFGLGIKLPTGNYQSEDYFYTSATDKSYKELAPVNVAIQLGDGGTGITTQLNGYYIFNKLISVYGNFFYLISPKDVNGVASWPPGLLPPDVATVYHEATYDVNSVPDNYSMRGGANFLFGNFVATAGLRYEGAPAHDLIGRDDGLRRVGHIFSVEPGIQYKFKSSFLYGFVTLPVARATIVTVPDKRIAEITNTPVSITPGHFANSIYYIGYTFTF